MGSAVKFIFTDFTRLTSLGGETSLSMMLATLGDAVEKVRRKKQLFLIRFVRQVFAFYVIQVFHNRVQIEYGMLSMFSLDSGRFVNCGITILPPLVHSSLSFFFLPTLQKQ